jgi:hypothetical protein
MDEETMKRAMQLMGAKGGSKRAASMTPAERSASAKKAAKARWKKAAAKKKAAEQ